MLSLYSAAFYTACMCISFSDTKTSSGGRCRNKGMLYHSRWMKKPSVSDPWSPLHSNTPLSYLFFLSAALPELMQLCKNACIFFYTRVDLFDQWGQAGSFGPLVCVHYEVWCLQSTRVYTLSKALFTLFHRSSIRAHSDHPPSASSWGQTG